MGALDDDEQNSPFPCLLFLDSLKMHNMQTVGKKVRAWLNSEWARLNPESIPGPGPFKQSTMIITSPEVPRQLNAYDCGVFVCRYAYGFLRIRSRPFSYRDAGIAEWTKQMHMHKNHKSLFKKSITRNDAFDFGMEDIDRIREEMKELIKRLSCIYIPFQEEQERQKKEDRKARKLAKQKADELKENTEAHANIVVHNPVEAADSTSSSASQKPAAEPTDGTGRNLGDDGKVETVEGELATLAISTMNPSESSSVVDPAVQEGASATKSPAREEPAPNAVDEEAIPMDIDSAATKDPAETLSASATKNAPSEEVSADPMDVEKDETSELVEPTAPSVDGDVGSEESSKATAATSSPDTNEEDDEQLEVRHLEESQQNAPVAASSLEDEGDANVNAEEEHAETADV